MPNETLKSLTMPIKSGGTTTETTYDIPQGDVKQTELDSLLTDYAKKEGTYEDLVAGSANQLIPSAMETESVPYNFRTAGGSLDIGDREFDKLVGLSLPWNQMWDMGSGSNSSTGISWTRENGKVTYSGTATSGNYVDAKYGSDSLLNSFVVGHRYLICANSTDNRLFMVVNNPYTDMTDVGKRSLIYTPTSKPTYCIMRIQAPSGTEISGSGYIQIIDLTQLFGSTIANYIYSLETATAGAGVAWFKKFFGKSDYAYQAGKIESVCVSSHDMVGFNAFDKSTAKNNYYINSIGNESENSDFACSDFIRVLPNTVYHTNADVGGRIYAGAVYDSNKTFIGTIALGNGGLFTTPSNAEYLRVNILKSIITVDSLVVNLHWDGARDGEYEPYKKNSYALDPIELRGILKLDSNNEPYADGDTYESDGTVTRKFGIVDLGTLNWEKATTRFYATVPQIKIPSNNNDVITVRSPKEMKPKSIASVSGVSGSYEYYITADGVLAWYLPLDSYSDGNALKTALSGVYAIFELATPTTESADPFTDPQTVDNWGTEQYVDKAYADGDRDVEIPVGHETKYPVNLRDKVETSPNAPTSDGDYIVHSESGQLTYIALGSTTTIQNILTRLEALEP